MRRPALLAGLLAVLFAGYSVLVAFGAFRVGDRQVALTFAGLYQPALLVPFRFLAILGGVEVTMVLAGGLFFYLLHQGHRLAAWAAAAVPLATVAEIAYKHVINQPGPPGSLSHPDGPSLTDLLEGTPGHGWSFPSGHMTRAVVVYGLLAFVAVRLAEREWVRRLAPFAAAVLLVAMAIDRLYLAVHWESDVIGGALLGGTFLAASISWLEWSAARPR